jgi:soluble lytic murein transglycosylase-like protein
MRSSRRLVPSSLPAAPAVRAFACAGALLALLGAGHARADVWGYVDADGKAHVATEKLDDRYQLFFRGRTNADAPAVPIASDGPDDALTRTAIYRRVVNHPNVERFAPLIARYAKQNQLDGALVKAVVAAESAFEPQAVSAKGALGLMQVIPETAARYGVTEDRHRTIAQKLFDPAINLQVGTRYLRDLLAMFAGDVPLALAAYNAGENTVLRYDRQVPPYPETQEYVRLVQQFQALYRPPAPAPVAAPAGPMRIRVPIRTAAPR